MISIRKAKKKMKRDLLKRIGKKKFKQQYGKTIFFTPYGVEVIFDTVYSRVIALHDDDLNLYSSCPNCGIEYDQIDYEYQICHLCKFNNNH